MHLLPRFLTFAGLGRIETREERLHLFDESLDLIAWLKVCQRQSVRAVGRSWGLPAQGLLEELAGRPGAPAGLGWLLEGARGE